MQALKERDRTVFLHYQDGTVISIEIDVDSNLVDAVDAFKCFLLAISFNPSLVDRIEIVEPNNGGYSNE